MSVSNQMRNYLMREGAASVDAIAASIPELNQSGGAERALLLLRLNPQFECTGTKWTTRGSCRSDKDAIQEAAGEYFTAIDCPGAPIANVVREVSKATQLDAPKVKRILSEQFMTANTNIFNRPKRLEDR